MVKKIDNLGVSLTLRIQENGDSLISCQGAIIKVNEMTVNILSLINERKSYDEIIESLLFHYDVELDNLEQDIFALVSQLLGAGILNDKIIHEINFPLKQERCGVHLL